MRRERNEYERIADNAVLLSLWARCQERNPGGEFVGDRLKVMKLAFLATYELYWQQVKALNLQFYRYKFGPYASGVNESWADLCKGQLMENDEALAVTDKGKQYATDFANDVLNLDENAVIAGVLDRVVRDYAPLDTSALLRVVYNMEARTLDAPDKTAKIEVIPQCREFTDILEESEASRELVMPPGWQTTLTLTFDDQARERIEASIEDTHTGRVYSGWEALLVDV